MKLSFSLEKKEASLETDIEGLVEKGLEYKKQNPNRKTRYQIRQEEKRRNKELEQKQFVQGMFMMLGLILIVLVICAIGSVFGG